MIKPAVAMPTFVPLLICFFNSQLFGAVKTGKGKQMCMRGASCLTGGGIHDRNYHQVI